MKPNRLPLLMLLPLVVLAQPNEYAQAQQLAKADAALAEHRQWVKTRLQPAFGTALQIVLRECRKRLPAEAMQPMALVGTLNPDGKLTRLVWRERHALVDCAEAELLAFRYPGAPLAAFHFELETGVPATAAASSAS